MATTAIEIDLRIGKEVNFTAYRGETWMNALPIIDALNEPVPLTDSTIIMEVRTKLDSTVLLTWDLDDGLSITGDDDNKITMNKIGDLPFIKEGYMYEITTTLSNDVVFKIWGKMKVQDVA